MSDVNEPNTPNSDSSSQAAPPVPPPSSPTPPPVPPTTNKVISLAIKDVAVLYSAYMPFVDKGGLFIPTKKEFKIGEVLPLLISLLGEEKKYQVDGKVIWITPEGAINNRVPGIGLQFNGSEAIELNQKIEKLLDSQQNNTERTNTM